MAEISLDARPLTYGFAGGEGQRLSVYQKPRSVGVDVNHTFECVWAPARTRTVGKSGTDWVGSGHGGARRAMSL